MAADDVIHLVVQGSLNAGLWQQSYYYQISVDSANEADNPVNVAKAWLTAVEPSLLAAISAECTVDCGTAQRVFPVPVGNTFIESYPGNNGDLTGESLPATNAAVITTLSEDAGAQLRGRKYIPGIRELDQQGGRVNAAEMALLQTLGTALTATLMEGAMEAFPVVAHRDPVTPFDVLSAVQIVQFTVRPRLGNQRRRRTFRTNVSA